MFVNVHYCIDISGMGFETNAFIFTNLGYHAPRLPLGIMGAIVGYFSEVGLDLNGASKKTFNCPSRDFFEGRS
jgi:hypothetical protein